MAAETHSFIDIAALDAVRAHFAAADAVAILSLDLAQVIWANGPGARMLGHSDIAAAIGAESGLSRQARRQIEATPGFPDIGTARTIHVRMASGATTMQVQRITLPGGESAMLLAERFGGSPSRSAEEIAARAISGFDEPGSYLAMLANGRVLAATEGFEALGIDRRALDQLTSHVVNESDRLLKRIVRLDGRAMPVGFARLSDSPPLDLLITVDEGWASEVPEPASAATDDQAPVLTEPVSTIAANEDMQSDAVAVDETTLDASPSDAEPAASLTPPAEPERSTTHDGWYFGDRASRDGAVVPEIDRNSAPVRFVWRTDAAGRFQSISPEFTAAVGGAAADVVGKTFAEIAKTLQLDPGDEIASLLARRDTWSGRSVLWPIAGTDLRAPVDLAALPTYDRDRNFEGFRGFGVVRRADALVDENAVGLALGQPESGAGTIAGEPEAVADNPPATPDLDEADPFKGEVPALEVEPREGRRFSDKVIRLAEHRVPANDKGLTPVERNAFREIGEQLKRTSGQPAETGQPTPELAADHQGDAATSTEPTATVAEPAQPPIRAVEAADAAEWHDAATPEPKALDETGPAPDASDETGDIEQTELEQTPDADDTIASVEAPESDTSAALPEIAREVTSPLSDEPSDDHAPVAETQPTAEPADDAAHVESRPQHVSRSLLDFVTDGEAAETAAANDDAPSVVPASASEPSDVASAPEPQDAPAVAIEPVEAPPPVREAPPLKQSGFVPSAFAPLDDGPRQADTSILSQLPVPVLIHSGDTLHFANHAFLELTGYPSLHTLADRGGLDAILSGPAENRVEGDNRVMLRRRDGTELPVSAFLQSVPWLGSKALLLTVTAQPEAAEPAPPPARIVDSELEARVAELRTILDTATDGVVLIANDGTIRSISRPAEALFGYDSHDVVGKAFASLFAIESQRSARDYLTGLSENGVASVLNDGREVIGREAQGRFIPLFMTIGRLPGDGGFCAVLRDITQWKRAEEDLTQARAQAERTSSQKSDFLARISHEIRTPLNAIIGFSELMLDEKFGPVANDRYRDYLRDINRSGNHVLDLVNDLLDISKIEAGQQELDYEAVALNDALAETVAMMQPQANRERVIIRSSFASKLPEVVADLRSVRQIALNILSNAVRYTQAGGQVIVSTAFEPNGEVVMRVRDTGIGMTPAEIEQALKPFKQINTLKRSRGDGTGLGLPLTKAMVEANRAKFSILSTPGEGTLVEVTFPSTRVLAE